MGGMSNSSSMLRSEAEELANLAGNLNELVKKFKIKDIEVAKDTSDVFPQVPSPIKNPDLDTDSEISDDG